MSATTLKTVIFFGSARNIVAPWGGDARLGDRVLNWVKSTLSNRSASLGSAPAAAAAASGDESQATTTTSTTITHEVHIIDPLEVFGPNGGLSHSGGELQRPTFFEDPTKLPNSTKKLQEVIKGADCYLIVSPEYNHSIPPALSSVMGHFGGSNYKCKPSGIVTYSPGPFAGMRAAMAIQVLCHELGCLPVSKLCGLPGVTELLESDGTPKDAEHRMLKQLPELLTQLEWMAVAMKSQREKTGTF